MRSGVEEEELPRKTLDNRELNDNGTCSSDNVRNRKTEKDKDLCLSGSGLGKRRMIGLSPIRRNSTIQARQKEELPRRTLDNREQNAIDTCSSDYVRKRKTKKDKN